MNGWLKLVSLSDGQSTVVGWSDGNSAHSAMVFAHGEIIVCNRFTVAKPLHHTECIDNALLRRERNEASQRSPKGSEVRLLARSDGDRRQAKGLLRQAQKHRSSKSSLLEIAFRISLFSTSIWGLSCQSIPHFEGYILSLSLNLMAIRLSQVQIHLNLRVIQSTDQTFTQR